MRAQEVIAAISFMDINVLDFLLEEPTYMDLKKKDFLTKLQTAFNHFKKEGDKRLHPHKGKCQLCQVGKIGFSFIGEESKDYIELVFDVKDNKLVDIYECNSFEPAYTLDRRNRFKLDDSIDKETEALIESLEKELSQLKDKVDKLPTTSPLVRKRNEPSLRRLYVHYFQKSSVFLYPLLGAVYCEETKPKTTLLVYNDRIRLEEPNLAVIFQKTQSTSWKAFERAIIDDPRHLISKTDLPNNGLLCLFDLRAFKEDYTRFLHGSYSKFSDKAKKAILRYYEANKSVNAYVASFLYPERYTKIYAELLDVSPNLLKEVGELCDKYNLRKETHWDLLVTTRPSAESEAEDKRPIY